MIFLDTNVVSELMLDPKLRHPNFTKYFNAQIVTDLYLPSIAVAEIHLGIEKLPPGKRRLEIEQAFQALLQLGFASRIASFNASCADSYAIARTTRQKIGRPITIEDALIGAMALAYRVPLATRNTTDFDGYGLTLINPWQP